MLTSTHKIAGSLTQSAMLHVGARRPRRHRRGRRARCGCCARRARRRCCSPRSTARAASSSLHGEQLLHETLEAIEVARAKLETIPGIALVDDVARRADGRRRLRPAADRRSTSAAPGRTGYEIADALRRSYDVHLELPMQATRRLHRRPRRVARPRCGAWRATSTRSSSASREPGATAPIVAAGRRRCATRWRVPPREAFLGEAEQVAVDDAVGRISCESIASYPPGVPALLPGERISAETVAYLRELAASGARLHGASDPRVPDHQRAPGGADDRSRSSAGPQYGEKPDYAGLLTFGGAPYTAGPRRARAASTSRSSARRWTTSSPTARARASRRARSAAASCPPGPHLEVGVDAFAALRVVDFGDAPVHPGRPGALARGDRGDRRPGARRPARCPVVLGGDHSITEPSVRACAAVHGPVGDGPLRHPHRHRRRGLRRRDLARHVHPPPRRRRARSTRRRYAQIGLRGYWPGEAEFAWQAERGITSLFMHDVRDLGIREVVAARDRGGRPRPGLPDRRRRRARPRVPRRRHRHARARAA